jgi:hypothetical protein
VIAVLDNSLSMRALENHMRAVDRVKRLQDSTAGRPMGLILAGESPSVAVEPEAGGDALQEALSAYDPYEAEADLAEALTLAREVAPGRLTVYLFTDQDVEPAAPAGTRLVCETFQGRAGNVALLEASRSRDRYSGKESVDLVCGNLAEEEQRIEVRASSANVELFAKTLTVGADASRHLRFHPPGGVDRLHVTLSAAGDALGADSEALLLPAPRRIVRYAVQELPEPAAEAVRKALDAAGARAAAQGDADLLVTGADAAGATGSYVLRIPPAEEEAAILIGPYVVDMIDPLCRDLSLEGVYWATGQTAAEPAQRSAALVSTARRPLYWRASSGHLVLDLDLQRSNIRRMPAWPVIFANLVDAAQRELPGLRRRVYAPGELLEYVVEAPVAPPPDGLRREDGELAWRGAQAAWRLPGIPGEYTVIAGGAEIGAIAVNVRAPAESDLGALAKQDKTRRYVADSAEGGARSTFRLGWLLMLGAVAAFLANWHLDRRA